MWSIGLAGVVSALAVFAGSGISLAKTLPAQNDVVKSSQPFVEILQNTAPKNFSWEDPMLQQILWAGGGKARGSSSAGKTHSLMKRSLPPKGLPLINLPNCIGCAEPAAPELDNSLASLTAQKMVTLMKYGSPVAGACLFYGQRPSSIWRNGGARSLSFATTDFACTRFTTRPYRTIWMLWNYMSDNDAAPYSNYFCLNPRSPAPSCWLNGFFNAVNPRLTGLALEDARKAAALPYFRAMSKAMALSCTGEVFIALDDRNSITAQQPGESTESIWLTHELPTLQYMYQKLNQRVNKLTVLTTIGDGISDSAGHVFDATSVLQQPIRADYNYNDGGNTKRMVQLIQERMEQDPQFGVENGTHLFAKRSCSESTLAEGRDQDWFG